MGKYDFIKLGNLLYWHDPDSGLSNGVYQVASIPENIEEDSVILIASDTSEAEVFPSELSPIHTGRSHKEDFLRWKTEREAEGIEFYDHLSKVMDTENDLSVGVRWSMAIRVIGLNIQYKEMLSTRFGYRWICYCHSAPLMMVSWSGRLGNQ